MWLSPPRVLRTRGGPVIRASVDGFHNPQEIRYRRGRSSPIGFYEDSYDYEAVKRLLLGPLAAGASGRIRRAIYDVDAERAVDTPWEDAPPRSILVFDGIFLHRRELRDAWDYSVFLDVGFDVSIPRGAQRGTGSPDPDAESNRRYVEGQRIYLAQCDPRALASIVVDNRDLAAPVITARRPGHPPGSAARG